MLMYFIQYWKAGGSCQKHFFSRYFSWWLATILFFNTRTQFNLSAIIYLHCINYTPFFILKKCIFASVYY